MIEKFLKAKHWQIFVITFGLPLLLQITLMPMTNSVNNPEIMMKIMPIIMIIFFVGFFGWFWSIAIGLQSKVPSGIKMKVRKFKILLFIPMIYIPLVFGLMDFVFDGSMQTVQEPSGVMIGVILSIIFPLHLLSMFGIFYSLYFVAKTFKTVELQREVSFSDFAGEFFMIWFFPIGIWVIQPKVNKMIE